MTSHCSGQCPCCASSPCRYLQPEMQWASPLLCRLPSQLMPAQAHSVVQCFPPFQLASAQKFTGYMQHQQSWQWRGSCATSLQHITKPTALSPDPIENSYASFKHIATGEHWCQHARCSCCLARTGCPLSSFQRKAQCKLQMLEAQE